MDETLCAYVARQAIVDKDQKIHGYELLFRDGVHNAFPNISGDEATSRLIMDALIDNRVERLIGYHRGFINFTQNTLLSGFPETLNKDNIVIELLEDIEPNPDVIDACRNLKCRGYTLALDDHNFSPHWRPFLSLIDIVKVDISAFDKSTVIEHIEGFKQPGLVLLAEKVETQADFEFYRAKGFQLFQGYFFCRPQIIKSRRLAPARLGMLKLMALANASPMDFDGIQEIFSRDAAMTFKLLKFVNSPALGLANVISSLRHAFVILGEQELKKFISLLAMANLAQGGSPALLVLSAVRARFCELFARKIGADEDCDAAFLTGLISLIEVILGDTKQNIFAGLPVENRIRDCVCLGQCPASIALNAAIALEHGDWQQVDSLVAESAISRESMADIYSDAVAWADGFLL